MSRIKVAFSALIFTQAGVIWLWVVLETINWVARAFDGPNLRGHT